jgi:GT2 family glycosyltransferase
LPPEVSIITVYYNSPEDLLSVHDSMLRHLSGDSYEWIIADNCSQEDLSSKLQDATYIRLPENHGFAKANNLAAAKAQGKYLFFVNPDCIFTENCLPPLLQAMRTAAVAGPRVVNEDGSLQLSFGPFLSVFSEFRQKRRMQNEKSLRIQNWIRSKGDFSPDYVSGCALIIRAEIYTRISGFDENFFLYEEDVDLCKRVRNLGERVSYVSSTSILHGRNKSVRKIQDRAAHEYRKSQVYYYKKHQSRLQNLLLKLYLTLFT